MTTRIRFLGVAGYEITGPSFRFLIDPMLTGNPVAPIQPDDIATPDVILVTHLAWDHLGDTFAIAERTGAPVVCGVDVRRLLTDQGLPAKQIQATVWGVVVEVAGVTIRPVESRHHSFGRLPSGSPVSGVPLGFIVETEPDVRVYHFGDSALFGDMRLIGDLHKPTVGILGCALPDLAAPFEGAGTMLTGEMDARQAALAAEFLGVRFAVASHYTDVSNPDVQKFLALVEDREGPQHGIALKPGQTLVIDGESHAVKDAG